MRDQLFTIWGRAFGVWGAAMLAAGAYAVAKVIAE